MQKAERLLQDQDSSKERQDGDQIHELENLNGKSRERLRVPTRCPQRPKKMKDSLPADASPAVQEDLVSWPDTLSATRRRTQPSRVSTAGRS